MDFAADLHTHSPYSRATSPEGTPAGLAAWARIKGLRLVGTGDFTHPGWLARLKEELVPAEPGLFRLKEASPIASPLPGAEPAPNPVRFMLSAEISGIYKRGGAVRKVHNLLYVPDFAAAGRIGAALAGIGNIESDGRPILGLDSRDLLEILLEKAPEGFLVPAHIWTPWFSLFGSRSGFDAIEECFGDLTPHVFALETGLSSDPDMNRLVSGLDRFALISNSDCHSPARLGREANLFSTELNFFALREALRTNRRDTFRGTVEFFPEEGKYHADGHRTCRVCLDPTETCRLNGLCPVCGKPLTVGVLHRVMALADRQKPLFGPASPKVFSLIPLSEVLGEILGTSPSSKRVVEEYGRAVSRFGSELALLLAAPLAEIRRASEILGEAIGRMREGRVIRRPGYDGQYGVIRLFEEGELEKLGGQGSLFGDGPAPRRAGKKGAGVIALPKLGGTVDGDPGSPGSTGGPNPEQAAAMAAGSRHLLVTAGPGTGKTFTLTARMAALLAAGCEPDRMAAVTFTVKAADELRERLVGAAGAAAGGVFTGTFHQFCLAGLRQSSPGLKVVGPESRARILRRLCPGLGAGERDRLAETVADHFCREAGDAVGAPHGTGGQEDPLPLLAGLADPAGGGRAAGEEPALRPYLEELQRLGAIDLDAVIPEFVRRLRQDRALRSRVQGSLDHLFVDEFQDLNESQFELVNLLAESARVFAIGDPDQAIYGFRGSDPAFFFRFAALPGVAQVFLTRNYRCPGDVLAAAAAVIARNRRPAGPPLTAETGRRGAIELYCAPTPAAEGEFIVRRIEALLGGIEHFSIASGRGGDGGVGRGLGFSDLAVLVRLGRQTGEIAASLERRGIPFQQVGSTPFYLSPELRPAHDFIQAAAGSEVIADWLRLAGSLAGIGKRAIEMLEAALPLTGDFAALAAPAELPAAAVRSLAELTRRLDRFRDEAALSGLSPALAGVLPWLGVGPEASGARRLLEMAGSFGCDLAALAGHLSRYAEASVYDSRAAAVALMTLHSAKGLEFPVVFLAGLEEGLLPCTLWNGVNLEEERRLFYVGLTRAQERVILSASASRSWAGPWPRQLSRFVGEIPEHLLTAAAPTPARKPKAQGVQQTELF
jgi:uncharacterized protein (TIGR00375 family)